MNTNELIKHSTIVYKHEEIVDSIDSLASKLNDIYHNKRVMILPVMTGVLTFAGYLLPRLDFDMELDYFHASRYENNKGGDQVKLIYEPQREKLEGQYILLLDDILDEGHTLKYIKERLKKINPLSIETAVLFDKHIDKKKPLDADYVGLKVPNFYVYGFGLDFNGIGRNMPHLYAYKA
tara:strand:- start:34831 stop:35367 length:537 start_codon:yes stop_codon:yes gene_type:complete